MVAANGRITEWGPIGSQSDACRRVCEAASTWVSMSVTAIRAILWRTDASPRHVDPSAFLKAILGCTPWTRPTPPSPPLPPTDSWIRPARVGVGRPSRRMRGRGDGRTCFLLRLRTAIWFGCEGRRAHAAVDVPRTPGHVEALMRTSSVLRTARRSVARPVSAAAAGGEDGGARPDDLGRGARTEQPAGDDSQLGRASGRETLDETSGAAST